ncbi:MAG: DUF4132 domain-containing protein [Archangiaceae bacterium]|nr:DUF4132 domain-containing protein [Archangiaceae bacterium]
MPGILDRFKSVFGALTTERTEAQRRLEVMQEQLKARNGLLAPEQAAAVQELLAGDEALQAEVLVESAVQISHRSVLDRSLWSWSFLPRLANLLLARKLPLTAAQAIALLAEARRPSVMGELSLAHLLQGLERFEQPLDPKVLEAVKAFDAAAESALRTNVYRKLAGRLAALTGKSATASLESGGPFSARIFDELAALPGEEAEAWRELFQLGFTLTAARPSAKWVTQAKALVAKLGKEAFAERARAWLQRGPVPGGDRDDHSPETDVPFIRALVFAVGAARTSALAAVVGTFALACYRKIPSRGPVSQAGGNACLWALGEVGLDGVGQLGMLKMRVKYAVALRLIDKALTDAAARAGLSTDDLEEIGVPTFDLDERSVVEEQVGDARARIEVVDGRDVKLSVRPASALKGTPELKALKARVKDIDAMLAAQRLRLERTYVSGRSWPLGTWRARLLEHPLLQGMARRLVWQADRAFTWQGAGFVDAAGAPVEPASEVKLWHPIDGAPWPLQRPDAPFKQVGRETFTLPVGARRTAQFSGRRVAQHRFNALARERGWVYRLQGGFDSQNDAVLTLPKWGLRAQLEVLPAPGTSLSDMGIYLYVETGEVVFELQREPPPRVLSEVLRDVALFVEAQS